MTSAETVCAVVVTRNRKALLEECLAAVSQQTRPPDGLLVVDNASTDGSPDFVAQAHPQAELVRLEDNVGGAGGFHEGIRSAASGGWDWLWLMDDDTIPRPDALVQLLEARGRLEEAGVGPAMLASKVVWTDGRVHPMNPPRLNMGDMDALVDGFDVGALPLRYCTFPSLLLRGDVPARFGLPRKEFFIWSDDIDYTARILREDVGYFVPTSVAVHKTVARAYPWMGGERFYYAVRNGLWLVLGGAFDMRDRFVQLLLVAETARRYLRHERYSAKAVLTVCRGVAHGLRPPAR